MVCSGLFDLLCIKSNMEKRVRGGMIFRSVFDPLDQIVFRFRFGIYLYYVFHILTQ